MYRRMPPCVRRCEEHAWHLEWSQLWASLRTEVVNLNMFKLLWTPRFKHDLFRYWKRLCGCAEPPTNGVSKVKGIRSNITNFLPRTKRSAQRYDIVEEYSHATEDWLHKKGPPMADVAGLIVRINEFLWEFSDQEATIPTYMHPALDEHELHAINVSPRHTIGKHGTKVDTQLMSNPISSTSHYYYRRWLWVQFPWMALAKTERLESLLLQYDSDAEGSNVSGVGGPGSSPHGSPHGRSTHSAPTPGFTEKGYWATKKISRLSQTGDGHGGGGGGARAAPFLGKKEEKKGGRPTSGKAKSRRSGLGSPTPAGTPTKPKKGWWNNLKRGDIPFNTPTVRTKNHGTRFPSIEAMERDRPDRPLNIFGGGSALESDTRAQPKYAAIKKDVRPKDNAAKVREKRKLVQKMRQRHDRLQHQAQRREDALQVLLQQVDEWDEQEAFTETCIDAGEAMMKALEARLGRMNGALLEADRLCRFYENVLEVCEVAPAKDTHHLKKLEKRLTLSRLQCEDTISNLLASETECTHIMKVERPALEEELKKHRQMHRLIVQKLHSMREAQANEQQNERMREKKRKEISRAAMGDMGAREERRLKKLNMQQTLYEAQLKTSAEAHKKRVKEYQLAFRRIREATGIDDPARIYEKFMNRDIASESLTEQQEDFELRIQELKNEKAELQTELNSLQYGNNVVSSRVIRQIDDETFAAENWLKSARGKHRVLRQALKDIKGGVVHLATMLGLMKEQSTDAQAMLGHDADDSGKLLQVIHKCEEKLVHMAEKLPKPTDEADDVGSPSSRRGRPSSGRGRRGARPGSAKRPGSASSAKVGKDGKLVFPKSAVHVATREGFNKELNDTLRQRIPDEHIAGGEVNIVSQVKRQELKASSRKYVKAGKREEKREEKRAKRRGGHGKRHHR